MEPLSPTDRRGLFSRILDRAKCILYAHRMMESEDVIPPYQQGLPLYRRVRTSHRRRHGRSDLPNNTKSKLPIKTKSELLIKWKKGHCTKMKLAYRSFILSQILNNCNLGGGGDDKFLLRIFSQNSCKYDICMNMLKDSPRETCILDSFCLVR